MPERTLQEHLVHELKLIRKRGLHRLPQYIAEVPALRELARRTSGGENAEHVENMLRTVYKVRSEGAQGTAIGILLGLEQGRRGANPAVLREAAAKRLGYHSVDTFRKRPEADAVATFAHLVESYAIDYNDSAQPDDYKINVALSAIKELTFVEYAELTRRLRAWFSQINRP